MIIAEDHDAHGYNEAEQCDGHNIRGHGRAPIVPMEATERPWGLEPVVPPAEEGRDRPNSGEGKTGANRELRHLFGDLRRQEGFCDYDVSVDADGDEQVKLGQPEGVHDKPFPITEEFTSPPFTVQCRRKGQWVP